MTVEVRGARADEPVAVELVGELQADLAGRYDDMGELPADPVEFGPPTGGFVLAWLDGVPAGCGAFRSHAGTTAEVNRMYVRPTARRRGVARAVLRAVEDAARAAGYDRIVLETGVNQPEAIALYLAAGYVPVPSWGEHVGNEHSRTFGRDLR